MDDVTIRPATSDDVAAIQRVARESWHAAYDDIVGSEEVDAVVDNWYDADSLRQSLDRTDGRFLVAERETGASEAVGFAQALLGEADDAAELPRIYVHPDHWGDGIGSELLDHIESWVREEGRERLRLIVMADNEVGNAFYESHGYRTIGSRESELEDETITEYVREKEL